MHTFRPFVLFSLAVAVTTVMIVHPLPAADERPAATADSDTVKKSVSVRPATWKQVQEFVASQKGKVVVLDLWSTSCLPCMVEFPELVKLQQQHKDGLVCVSFNLDYAGIKSKPPEYYQPRVEKFLTSRKAELQNFLSTEEAVEVFDQVGINAIPAVLVYGKDGKLARRFDESLLTDGNDEAFTYQADINPFVEQLLK
jgi:thiol-disulfide isomerase/thioredoxin